MSVLVVLNVNLSVVENVNEIVEKVCCSVRSGGSGEVPEIDGADPDCDGVLDTGRT